MSDNIFKAAAIHKLRFPSIKGQLMVEQLYDLPLTSKNGFDLDTVAKGVNADLKALSEESFVETAYNPGKDRLQVALDVVKEVIADKIAAAKAASEALAKKNERQRLLEILAKKKDGELEGLTVAEIEAKIAAL